MGGASAGLAFGLDAGLRGDREEMRQEGGAVRAPQHVEPLGTRRSLPGALGRGRPEEHAIIPASAGARSQSGNPVPRALRSEPGRKGCRTRVWGGAAPPCSPCSPESQVRTAGGFCPHRLGDRATAAVSSPPALPSVRRSRRRSHPGTLEGVAVTHVPRQYPESPTRRATEAPRGPAACPRPLGNLIAPRSSQRKNEGRLPRG